MSESPSLRRDRDAGLITSLLVTPMRTVVAGFLLVVAGLVIDYSFSNPLRLLGQLLVISGTFFVSATLADRTIEKAELKSRAEGEESIRSSLRPVRLRVATLLASLTGRLAGNRESSPKSELDFKHWKWELEGVFHDLGTIVGTPIDTAAVESSRFQIDDLMAIQAATERALDNPELPANVREDLTESLEWIEEALDTSGNRARCPNQDCGKWIPMKRLGEKETWRVCFNCHTKVIIDPMQETVANGGKVRVAEPAGVGPSLSQLKCPECRRLIPLMWSSRETAVAVCRDDEIEIRTAFPKLIDTVDISKVDHADVASLTDEGNLLCPSCNKQRQIMSRDENHLYAYCKKDALVLVNST